MALAVYNGFTGEQRMAAHHWQLGEIAAGRLPSPTVCMVCGQRGGALDMHLEDYDQPDRYFPLCLSCHLALHMRFHRRARFLHYRDQVKTGWRAPALPRRGGFGQFNRTIAGGLWPVGTWHERLGSTFLDLLPLERGVPAKFLMPDDYAVVVLAHPAAA